MKDITVKELSEVMGHEDRKLFDLFTEITPLETASIGSRKQIRKEHSISFSDETKIEVKTLAVNTTMKCGVLAKDIVLSLFYNYHFSYSVADMSDTCFGNLHEASRHSEEQGILGHNIVDLKDHPKAQEALATTINFLRVSAKRELREYLDRNHSVQDAKFWSNFDGEPTQFYLKSDNDFDLCFKGYQHGEVKNRDFGTYSLFETDDGTSTYICQKIDPSGVIETRICLDYCEIIDYFGFNPLSKKLYRELGFNLTKVITGEGVEREAKRKLEYGNETPKYFVQ